MSYPNALLALLDSRSFSSLWYWLGFAVIWMRATRTAFGTPADWVLAARRGDGDAVARLRDWLRLVLPRWRVTPGQGMVLSALSGFGLAVLWGLGFGMGRQAAQALFLLLAPLGLLLVLRLRLAQRLDRMLAADAGAEAVQAAARALARHGWLGFALSLLAMLAAAMVAGLWLAHHPLGV